MRQINYLISPHWRHLEFFQRIDPNNMARETSEKQEEGGTRKMDLRVLVRESVLGK